MFISGKYNFSRRDLPEAVILRCFKICIFNYVVKRRANQINETWSLLDFRKNSLELIELSSMNKISLV